MDPRLAFSAAPWATLFMAHVFQVTSSSVADRCEELLDAARGSGSDSSSPPRCSPPARCSSARTDGRSPSMCRRSGARSPSVRKPDAAGRQHELLAVMVFDDDPERAPPTPARGSRPHRTPVGRPHAGHRVAPPGAVSTTPSTIPNGLGRSAPPWPACRSGGPQSEHHPARALLPSAGRGRAVRDRRDSPLDSPTGTMVAGNTSVGRAARHRGPDPPSSGRRSVDRAPARWRGNGHR